MDRTMSVEFRGAVVEVRYMRYRDSDVLWEFVDEPLNRIKVSGQERQDIRREVLAREGM